MFKISEKFFNNLGKLENYFVLRAEDEEIIVGTKNKIKTAVDYLGNIFQPQYNKVVEREYPVFFLLTTLEKSKGLKGEFEKKNLPVKVLSKSLMNDSKEKIREKLNEFVLESF